MARSPLPERRTGRTGGNESVPEPEVAGRAPMDRFRALTKRLLSVSREEVTQAEAKRSQQEEAERKN